jgi:hypothetical protein
MKATDVTRLGRNLDQFLKSQPDNCDTLHEISASYLPLAANQNLSESEEFWNRTLR